MEKKIRLFDYQNNPKEIVVKDFDKVLLFIFEIKSGDGVLKVIYDTHFDVFDTRDDRTMNFHDGTWHIKPKDIDVLNRMKDHYDTEELDALALQLGEELCH